MYDTVAVLSDSHPSMLASVVMVVLGDINGILWDRCCLFDHQRSVWTRSLLTKIGWRNVWVHCEGAVVPGLSCQSPLP